MRPGRGTAALLITPAWLVFFLLLTMLLSCFQEPEQRPNILWITSEDNGPHLGAFGDTYATTPILDKQPRESRRGLGRVEREGPLAQPHSRSTVLCDFQLRHNTRGADTEVPAQVGS